MICAHPLAHIFIKFEQYNKKIQRNELVMICTHLPGSLIQNENQFSKKKKKKENKREERKIKERE